MKTRIRKRMRLFLLEKEDIFQIKLFLLMANLSRLSLGSSVSWENVLQNELKVCPTVSLFRLQSTTVSGSFPNLADTITQMMTNRNTRKCVSEILHITL